MDNTKLIKFNLDEETYNKLRELSLNEFRTVPKMASMIIHEYLESVED